MLPQVQSALNAVDAELLSAGFISYEEYSALATFKTVEEWLGDRGRFSDYTVLATSLCRKINVKVATISALKNGYWLDSLFVSYFDSMIYADSLTEELISNGWGLYIPHDIAPSLTSSHGASKALLPALREMQNLEKYTLSITGNMLSAYAGIKRIPTGISIDGFGKGEVIQEMNPHFPCSSELWNGVVTSIMAKPLVRNNNLYILSGTLPDHIKKTLSNDRHIVVDLLSLTAESAGKLARDIQAKHKKVIITSPAFNLGDLFLQMNGMFDVDMWLSQLCELHIRYEMPRICSQCALKRKESAYSQLNVNLSVPEGVYSYAGPGCEYCIHGYDGSVIIEEHVNSDNKVDFINAISSYLESKTKNPAQNIFQIYSAAHESKYPTTFKSLSRWMSQGLLSHQDVTELLF